MWCHSCERSIELDSWYFQCDNPQSRKCGEIVTRNYTCEHWEGEDG